MNENINIKEKLSKIFDNTGLVKELIVAGAFMGFGIQMFPGILESILANKVVLTGVGISSVSGFLMWLSNEGDVRKKIDNVFKNVGCGVKNGGYPRCVYKHKTYYGWRLIYKLPEGLNDIDIRKTKRDLEIAVNSEIEIWEQNGKVFMDLYGCELKNKVDWKEIEEIKDVVEKKNVGFCVGKSRGGFEVLDLIETQHMLIAGESGGGKTNLFNVLAINFVWRDRLKLFIVDVKRNLGYLKKHSWFASEFGEIKKMVDYLSAEMTRRYKDLDRLGVDSIERLKGNNKDKYDRLVLMIDEFGGLSPSFASGKEKNRREEIVNKIVDLMNRGRGCGVYVIIGTQRPDRELMNSGQIKACCNVRFCFRVVDDTNSQIILDSGIGVLLPNNIAGRCYLRGRDRLRQVQIFKLDRETAEKLLPGEARTKPEIESEFRKNGVC